MNNKTSGAHVKAGGAHVKASAPRRRGERRTRLAIPFFAVLFGLSIVGFILPLHPTRSQMEKRQLAQFPAFSVQALFSGSYFDDISTWYADTFPGRETYLTVNRAVEQLHGLSENVVNLSAFSQADEIPVVAEDPSTPAPTPTAAATADPEPTPEVTPEPTPEVTPEPTPEPTPELIAAPPEEMVESWGGLGDNGETILLGNAIQIGDRAFNYYGFSKGLSDRYCNLLIKTANWVDEYYHIPIYNVLIPSSVGVMVSSEIMEQIKCSDQGAAIAYINGSDGDKVIDVNIFNTLIEHNDEYLYFYTDHHWTALGAYYGYVQFCAVRGFEPKPLDYFEELDMGEYLGTTYYDSAQPGRLKHDTCYAYVSPTDLYMVITNEAGGTFEWPVIYDRSASGVNSKYLAFLSGDWPLLQITNRDLPEDGPSCVVIKDSNGNPFIPFLAENYRTVYAVDPRKMTFYTLSGFLNRHPVDEIIIAENLTMATSNGMLNLMEWLFQ